MTRIRNARTEQKAKACASDAELVRIHTVCENSKAPLSVPRMATKGGSIS